MFHAAKVKPLQQLQPNQVARKINSFKSGLTQNEKMGFNLLTENAQIYLIRHIRKFFISLKRIMIFIPNFLTCRNGPVLLGLIAFGTF